MTHRTYDTLRYYFFAVLVALVIGGLTGFVVTDLDETDQYSFLYDMTHGDQIDMIVMGEHYGSVATYWKAEVARRYSDVVMILAHGGPDEETGDWIVEDGVQGKILKIEQVVADIRKRFPYRRVVFVTCNAGHQYLQARFVSYALDKVWFWPDYIMYVPMNKIRNGHGVGNIFDFVENP